MNCFVTFWVFDGSLEFVTGSQNLSAHDYAKCLLLELNG